jgi:beta-lactamase class A
VIGEARAKRKEEREEGTGWVEPAKAGFVPWRSASPTGPFQPRLQPPARGADGRRVRRPAFRLWSVGLALASLLAACAATPARSAPTPATSAPAADTVGLRAALERTVEGYGGVVGVAVRDLGSGRTVSIRGDEPFPAASLIKVHVLVTLMEEVHAGRVRFEEPITMIDRDRVGGTGVLRQMGSGHRVSVEEAARLMITVSDNVATNLLLDKLDIRTVWAAMEARGLPRSKIHSKTFRRETSVAMDSSVKYGLGVTTPDETMRLFTLLHEGRAVSPALDSVALAILRGTEDGSMLRRWLPDGTPVAHKSGAIDRARNDCGILYGPAAPVAVCVMTRDNQDTSYAFDAAPHRLVARVGREVFRHFNPGTPLSPIPER